MMDISDPIPQIVDNYAVEIRRPGDRDTLVIVVPAEDSGRASILAKVRASCEMDCTEDVLQVVSVKWAPKGETP